MEKSTFHEEVSGDRILLVNARMFQPGCNEYGVIK